MKTKYILLLILVVFAVLPAEAQCAMCRAVLESEESGAAAEGINNGIVYLMLFPYLLVGGVAFAIYRMYAKSKQKEASSDN
jgi:flagellar basal body-associated protein FliL